MSLDQSETVRLQTGLFVSTPGVMVSCRRGGVFEAALDLKSLVVFNDATIARGVAATKERTKMRERRWEKVSLFQRVMTFWALFLAYFWDMVYSFNIIFSRSVKGENGHLKI